jgi:hypothetical protein
MTECMQIPKYRQIHRQVATFTLCVGPMNSNTIKNYFLQTVRLKLLIKKTIRAYHKICAIFFSSITNNETRYN